MTATSRAPAEAPSGKGASDENFPVGSFLLPARLRPHVLTFYAYARAIDDIADSPFLSPEEKLARLDGFDAAILGQTADPGYAKAHAIRESLAATKVPVQHCRDLISAFKQDAVKQHYADWTELMDYCNRSAAPVGRYLLDLHGERPANYPWSDALCNALQVINHLQDCKDDYRNLNRVYLPGNWMAASGVTVAALDAPSADPGLRRVLDRCLDGVEALLVDAAKLPDRLVNRRLACESAAILHIARRLTVLLRRRDPIANRVQLGKGQFLWCCVRGVIRSFG